MTKKLFSTFLILSIALVSALYAVPGAFSRDGGADVKASGLSGKTFEKDIRKNMKNDEVTDLQKELVEQGLLKVRPTGFFGSLTEKAVKDFQKAHGLPETGEVDEATREDLNASAPASANEGPSANSGPGNAQAAGEGIPAQIKILTDMVNELKAQVLELQAELKKLGGQVTLPAEPAASAEKVDANAQAKAGIIITGGVSGPGYPTGPLNLTVPAAQLLFDRAGQAKENPGNIEIKDRQYEAPMETIPPAMGAFPVTINGVANTATQLKVISGLKTNNGVGQHQGTIDVDIDTIPAGHLTIAYSGTATVAGTTATGLTITSKGTFKSSKTTGIFTGLVAEGTYEMTIVESGTAVGAPVTVAITTVSP